MARYDNKVINRPAHTNKATNRTTTEFNSTGAVYTGQEESAGRELESSAAGIGKSISKIGKDMEARDSLADASIFQTKLTAESSVWKVKYKDDQEGLNNAYDTFYAENSQDLRGSAGQQAATIGNRYIANANADYLVREAEAQYETEQVAIIDARQQDGDNSELYASKGEYEVGTSFLNSKIDSINADDALNAYQKAQMIKNAEDSYALSAHQAIINNFIETNDTEGLASYLENVQNNLLPSFITGADETNNFASNDAKALVLKYGANALSGSAASNTVLIKSLNTSVDGLVKNTKDGFVVSPEASQKMLDDAIATGDAKLIQKANNWVNVNKFLNEEVHWKLEDGTGGKVFGEMSLDEQAKFLESMKSNPETAKNKLLIETAESMLKTARTAGLEYGASRGWFENPPMIWDANADQTITTRVVNHQIMLDKLGPGWKGSIFNEDEINDIISQAYDNPAILREIGQGAGDNISLVISQLGSKDGTLAIAASMYASDDPKDLLIAGSILKGANARKLNPQGYPSDNNTVYNGIINKAGISDAYSSNPVYQKALREAIKDRYAAIADEKGIHLSDWDTEVNSEILSQAIKDVSPPLAKINGRWVTLPEGSGATWDNAQDKADEFYDGITKQSLLDAGVTPETIDDVYVDSFFSEGLNTGLRLVPYGDGYSLIAPPPAGPVLNAEGGLVIIGAVQTEE